MKPSSTKFFPVLLLLLLSTALFAQDKERLRKSLQGLATTTNDTMRIKYLDNIGWDTSYDNLAVGLKYCHEALALAEKINYEKGIAHACNSLGTIYQDLGDANKALEYHLRGLKLAEKNKDDAAITTACMNISIVYVSQQDHREALQYLVRARKISESMADSSGLVGVYSNLGMIYLAFPDSIPKAFDVYDKAVKLAYALNDKNEIGTTLGGIARVYQALGDTVNADISMKRSMDILDSMQNDYSLSQSMVNYAAMLNERGHFKQAEKLMLDALVIYRKIGMVEQEKELWQGLSDIYERSGQLQKSLDALKRHATIKDSLMNEHVLRHQRELETLYQTEKNANIIASLEKDATLSKTILISLIGGCLLLLLFLLVLFNRSQLRKKTNMQLEKQNAIIEEKNKDITDSINYARRIQDAILPPPGLMKLRFSDAFVFYRPRDIVSGDFWWSTEKNGKFVVACADCTGHGVPGGFMSVMSAAFLSEIVNEKGITEPDMILSHLRRKVISALNKSPENNSAEETEDSKDEIVKDGMDIVVCTFSDDNEFHFACANNPLWIVSDNKVTVFPPDKYPVGVYHGDIKPFTLQSARIKKGDMIYIFSDGFADQFGGEHGKKFKYKPFQDLLISISSLPGKEQHAKMDATFDEWRGNLEQVDDVLVIGIRI
jgi:serine phosphatase RsbU (regulator of sigma subunit)